MKLAFSALALASLVAACGGSTPPAEEPQNEAPPPTHHDDNGGLKIKSELGSIDEQATDKLLKSLDPKFDDCQKARLSDVPVISGKLAFFVRVGEDGVPKYAYLEKSELGDRDTEQCIVKTIMDTHFPKPDGGEAEVRHFTSLLLPQDTRVPINWSADKVADAASAAAQCGASGAEVTAYVAQGEKKKEGKIVAAGVALPKQGADEAIDCVVEALKKAKVPSPGSYYAKVSFTL